MQCWGSGYACFGPSGSISQRCGSGSAPKCHGSPTLGSWLLISPIDWFFILFRSFLSCAIILCVVPRTELTWPSDFWSFKAKVHLIGDLKGQCHVLLDFRLFFIMSYTPYYPIGAISKMSEDNRNSKLIRISAWTQDKIIGSSKN